MSSTDVYATLIDSHFRLRLFNSTHTHLPFTCDTSATRLPLSPLFTNNGEKSLINHLVYSGERMDSYMPNSKTDRPATQNRPDLFTAFTSYCKALISVFNYHIHSIQNNLSKKISVSEQRNFEMTFLLDRSVPPERRQYTSCKALVRQRKAKFYWPRPLLLLVRRS